MRQYFLFYINIYHIRPIVNIGYGSAKNKRVRFSVLTVAISLHRSFKISDLIITSIHFLNFMTHEKTILF